MPDSNDGLNRLSDRLHRAYRRHGRNLLSLSIVCITAYITSTAITKGLGDAVNNLVMSIAVIFTVTLTSSAIIALVFPHLMVQMPGDNSPRFLICTMIIMAVLAVCIPLTSGLFH